MCALSYEHVLIKRLIILYNGCANVTQDGPIQTTAKFDYVKLTVRFQAGNKLFSCTFSGYFNVKWPGDVHWERFWSKS